MSGFTYEKHFTLSLMLRYRSLEPLDFLTGEDVANHLKELCTRTMCPNHSASDKTDASVIEVLPIPSHKDRVIEKMSQIVVALRQIKEMIHED